MQAPSLEEYSYYICMMNRIDPIDIYVNIQRMTIVKFAATKKPTVMTTVGCG